MVLKTSHKQIFVFSAEFERNFFHDGLWAAQNLLCKLAEGKLNVPSANLHQ